MAAKARSRRTNSKGKASDSRSARSKAVASARAGGNPKGAGKPAPRKAKGIMKKKKARARVMELSVVGLEHRITHHTMAEMVRELPLKCYLQREPDNMHDPNAVMVRVHPDNEFRAPNWHIGYLRRAVAEELAPKMDAGNVDQLDCELTAIDTETWREGTLKVILGRKEAGLEIRP